MLWSHDPNENGEVMSSFEGYAKENGIHLFPWDEDELALEAITDFYTLRAPQLETSHRDGKPMILDFHLIDAPGFNALAASFDDADVIAVYRGIFPVLLASSRALVSHGLLFAEHRSADQVVEGISAGTKMRDIALGSNILTCGPLADPIREKLAWTMYDVASQFVLNHEFAHIANGHIDWLNRQTGLPLLAEMTAPNLPSYTGWERETLEWDADCAGVHFVLEAALRPSVTVVEGRAAWSLPLPSGDPASILLVQLTFAGLFLVFMCMASLNDREYDDPEPGSHPHPLLRLLSAQKMIFHTLEYRTGSNHDIYHDEYAAFLAPFYESWTKVFTVRDSIFKVVGADVVDVLNERIAKWEACWAEMHDQLNELKRGPGLLAHKVQAPHPAFLGNDAHSVP